MGGPCTSLLVSTMRTPAATLTPKRSSPRGAGPPFFSPTRLYFEPWHGHSNHCELLHHGTRQPRCTHFWYSATTPLSMPVSTAPMYTFLYAGFLASTCVYELIHVRVSSK